jgi:hypothetical protein
MQLHLLSQSFITFMDGLRLRMRAKDQLHPMLQELVTGYARFKASKDWEGRSRMVSWCVCRRKALTSVSCSCDSKANNIERYESF